MKDYFSANSAAYKKFRPEYPPELFAFLETLIPSQVHVWDCATGNGQVARGCLSFAEHIEATDISANQLKNAFQDPRIHYSQQTAEQTCFEDHCFDAVLVGQAVHWFDFERFYAEVKRVLKPEGILVVLGYGNIRVNHSEIDAEVRFVYGNMLGRYWDPERRYIDEFYRTIPFPFQEIAAPDMEIVYTWSKAHLIGYISTWSAWKHYRDESGNPDILTQLFPNWDESDMLEVRFPVLCRIGRM